MSDDQLALFQLFQGSVTAHMSMFYKGHEVLVFGRLDNSSGDDKLKISTCYEEKCTAGGTTSLVDVISLK